MTAAAPNLVDGLPPLMEESSVALVNSVTQIKEDTMKGKILM